MEVDSIVQTSPEWTLTAADRCDSDCTAQAYVRVVGVSGDLMFCGHHYEKIMSSPSGYEKMMQFSFEFTDERDKLVENRLIGKD